MFARLVRVIFADPSIIARTLRFNLYLLYCHSFLPNTVECCSSALMACSCKPAGVPCPLAQCRANSLRLYCNSDETQHQHLAICQSPLYRANVCVAGSETSPWPGMALRG